MTKIEFSQEKTLKNWKPRFFAIFAGQALSIFGSSLVQFALVWYLTSQTGSATVLTTATLFAILPQIVLGPFSGALVDRWNRRAVMVVADAFTALATLALALLFWSGRVQIWHIFAVMTLRSIAGSFQWTAFSASITLMVPPKHYTRIAGMQQMLQGMVSLVAPPTGALLLEVLHTQGVLAIDVTTALFAILPLLFLSIPQPDRPEQQETGTYRQDLAAGWRYVTRWRGLMALLLMAMLINFLLTPTSSLLPLLVTRHFGKGALELGFTDTLWGVGTIAGGLLLGVWGGFRKRISTSLMGIIGIGMGILLVGLAPAHAFPLALAAMGLAGLMQVMANGPLQAILQAVVAPEMQGRVMSLIGSAATAMSPLSLMIAGPLSDAIGIRTWYWIGGSLCLLMGIGGYFIPDIMNLEESSHATPAMTTLPAAD